MSRHKQAGARQGGAQKAHKGPKVCGHNSNFGAKTSKPATSSSPKKEEMVGESNRIQCRSISRKIAIPTLQSISMPTCCDCGKSCAKKAFSKSQLKKPTDKRRCKGCADAPKIWQVEHPKGRRILISLCARSALTATVSRMTLS